MFDNLIKFALQKRLIVLIVAVFLSVFGTYTAINMPVDIFPDLTAPTVTILTEAHGMATEEVEALVTFPIESAVNGATDVRRVRSSSAPGLSIVWVEFDWGTDIFLARQIVSEKLQTVSSGLPDGIDNPVLAPISSIMGEIMLLSLSIDEKNNPLGLTETDVRTFADSDIRKRLLSITGVSQVIPLGGGVKQYQILVSPEKLASYGISLKEVMKAAEGLNENSSGGTYFNSGSEYLIRGLGRVEDLEDIKKSVVAVRDGAPVLFEDLADVTIGVRDKIGIGSKNAKPAVILNIQKQPETNTVELTERIEQMIAEVEKSLPKGMVIDSKIYRQADFIEVSINNVISALRDGVILVIIVIFLFLWNFRTTFISVLAIPLSIVVTVIIFSIFDIMINTMTLGGIAIAIGALVDDAIIDVENVFRRLRGNSRKSESERATVIAVIYEASKEIRAPMVNATLIIVVVFLPLFFLSGVEGRLLRPMGYAYITSIFSSLFIALTVTPVLAYYLFSKSEKLVQHKETWLVEWLKSFYGRVLEFTISNAKKVIFTSLFLFIGTLAVVPFLGRSFLPEFNEGALTISLVTLPGTSLAESDRIGVLAEEIILSHKEVVSTARRTGRAELDEHAQGSNASELEVAFNLDGSSREEFFTRLRNSLAALPGTNVTIGQPIGHRIDHMLSGTRANIAVKIFGKDLQQLRAYSSMVKEQMASVEGAVDVSVDQEMEVPQTKIKFDRLALARYGMTVSDIAEEIDIAFNGEVATEIQEGQNKFGLIVRFDEENRGDIDKIRNALFDVPTGGKVPLTELAEVVNEKGPNRISRENVQRKIVVQANVSGRDLRGVVDEIREKISSNVRFEPGYYVEFGGQFESEQEATRIIILLSLVSLAIILLILFLQFGNLKYVMIILLNLPLALIGGIWSVFLTDKIISVASLVGFITLFGIATRNGILLLTHYDHLLAEGRGFRDTIVQGSLERLNPILMTALTAGLALVPLVLGGGEPGKEIETPMAVVIMGGLITSTILNMIVIPAVFYIFGKKAD
ncbi:MAG: multidrug transporter AcrB [Chlorobiota bacterium]|nr:MAG: efflux RND transporter permease subunit [Chlorobiota bacterium]